MREPSKAILQSTALTKLFEEMSAAVDRFLETYQPGDTLAIENAQYTVDDLSGALAEEMDKLDQGA